MTEREIHMEEQEVRDAFRLNSENWIAYVDLARTRHSEATILLFIVYMFVCVLRKTMTHTNTNCIKDTRQFNYCAADIVKSTQ